ncbi:MAG: hypothetical protein GX675_01680 [Erysipelotrichaceae bacterium]|nr:hypothetical protein [Erysipelotrichaceae bacterium]
MKKVGLVLGGGGTKGAYQAGAVKALQSLDKTWSIICGTSIGALNGAMLVQEDYDEFYDLWTSVKAENIVNGAIDLNFDFEDVVSKPNSYLSFFRKYVGTTGADIQPLKNMMNYYFDKERFMASNIDYGCVIATYPGMRPVYITKKMMYERGIDYMLASSACFPIFPTYKIDDNVYIDGGYADNLPVDLAFELGAQEIIAIDLIKSIAHPNLLNRENITYIYPRHEIGPLFNFDKELINKNIACGFNDVYKTYGLFSGYKYTFEKFDKPEFYDEFYIEILRLENKISRQLTFKDDAYITNHFLKVQHKAILSSEDLGFGIIDEIMSMLKMPVEEVYSFEKLCLLILETFKNAFSKDYEVLPSLSIEKLKEFIGNLDKIGMVSKIINQTLYPKKTVVKEEILLSIAPIDVAIASWIIHAVNYITKKEI